MTQYVATITADRLLELPQTVRQLLEPGQVIEIELPDTLRPQPNEKALAMLRDLALMKKDMPESDPSDTNEIIREGRSGAIYGF